MTEPLPAMSIDHLSLPLPDAAAARRATDAMRDEVVRLWQADRAAGREWRNDLESVSSDCETGETPEATGRRLAGAIRDRLVKEQLG